MKKSTGNRAVRTGRGRRAAGVVAVFSVVPAGVGTAHAQSWLYVGTDYGHGPNWSTGVTPGAGQTATFNSSAPNQPIMSGNFTIGDDPVTRVLYALDPGLEPTVRDLL